MLQKSFLYVVCIWLIPFSLLSQGRKYNYTQYTVADGLPTNYVYGVIEDDEGYIWAYTENGISKFDGYTFTNFSTLDGLGGNDVILLNKDSLGYMYASAYNGSVTSIKGDTLNLVKSETDSVFGFSRIFGEHIFNGKNYSYNFREGEAIKRNRVIDRPAENIIAYTQSLFPSIAIKKSKDTYSAIIIDTVGTQLVSTDLNLPEELFKIANLIYSYYIIDKTMAFLVCSSSIILYNTESGEYKFYYWNDILNGEPKDVTLSMCFDGSYHFDTSFGSVIFNDDMTPISTFIPQNIIDEYSVLRYYKDSKNNYWIGSVEGGLFFISASEFNSIKYNSELSKDKVFRALVRNRDNVYAISEKLNLYSLKDTLLPYRKSESDLKFNSAHELNEGEIILCSRDEPIVIDFSRNKSSTLGEKFDFEISDFTIDPIFSASKLFINIKDIYVDSIKGNIYLTNSNYLILINLKEKAIELIGKYNTTDFHKSYYNGELYVSNFKNLIKIEGDTVRHISTFPDEISTIFSIDQNRLLIGTLNSGLYLIDLTDRISKKIASANSVTKIKRYKNELFMASKDGLIVSEMLSDSLNVIYKFDMKDGLSSNIVYDFLIDDLNIVMATAEGVVRIENSIPDATVSVDNTKFITNINLSGIDIALGVVNEYASNANDLNIEFKLLEYASKGNIHYEYKLSPVDEQWNSTKELQVRYSDLQAGEYSLKLKATDAFGSSYVLSQDYKFIVKQSLWKSPFLFVSIFLLGCLLVYYLVKRRELLYDEKLRKEKAINSRIAELQMESLRSQMNPHFIFNALGSIQYYIQTHKVDEADLYLTKFAHLMRQYLESATENMIALDNEIKLLNDYLDLESMRFEFLFKYEIIVDDNLKTDGIYIPSMLLQPYVENAINHGLQMRKDGNGLIFIAFDLNNKGNLICQISDNGIGRKKSELAGSKLHKSRGMSNINKRVEVLKNTEICELEISISEAYEDKEFPGTKIYIEFVNLKRQL